jgi:hypothetical protein
VLRRAPNQFGHCLTEDLDDLDSFQKLALVLPSYIDVMEEETSFNAVSPCFLTPLSLPQSALRLLLKVISEVIGDEAYVIVLSCIWRNSPHPSF